MKKVRIVLDDILKQQNMTRYELSKRTNIKFQTIDNYYKNKVIRYNSEILLKICISLSCDIADIIKIVEIEE